MLLHYLDDLLLVGPVVRIPLLSLSPRNFSWKNGWTWSQDYSISPPGFYANFPCEGLFGVPLPAVYPAVPEIARVLRGAARHVPLQRVLWGAHSWEGSMVMVGYRPRPQSAIGRATGRSLMSASSARVWVALLPFSLKILQQATMQWGWAPKNGFPANCDAACDRLALGGVWYGVSDRVVLYSAAPS